MGCDVRCPAVHCSSPQFPKFECPALNCPDVELPGVKCGDVKSGDLHCPTINFPGLQCEPMKCPDINYPQFNCPGLKCTDLVLNCPQCIDNSLGVVIMVTVLASLTLILVFIYKMKQSHDRSKKYRNSHSMRGQDVDNNTIPLRKSKSRPKKSGGISLTEITLDNEQAQVMNTECDKEFDFKEINNFWIKIETKNNEEI